MISFNKLVQFLLVSTLQVAAQEKVDTRSYELPPLDVDAGTMTLAGFSSGAFMAAQLHVVFSGTFKGAGLFNGGPYGVGYYAEKLKENYKTGD